MVTAAVGQSNPDTHRGKIGLRASGGRLRAGRPGRLCRKARLCQELRSEDNSSIHEFVFGDVGRSLSRKGRRPQNLSSGKGEMALW